MYAEGDEEECADDRQSQMSFNQQGHCRGTPSTPGTPATEAVDKMMEGGGAPNPKPKKTEKKMLLVQNYAAN